MIITRRKSCLANANKKNKTYNSISHNLFLNLKINSYELIVHEIDSLIHMKDFLAIENTISFLPRSCWKNTLFLKLLCIIKIASFRLIWNNRSKIKEELNEK